MENIENTKNYNHHAKKIFLFLAVISVTIALFVGSPFLTLYNVKNSVVQKDFEKFSQNIDFFSVKESLKKQIYQALEKNKKEDFLKKLLVEKFAQDFVNKEIDKAIDEKKIFDLLIGKKEEKEKSVFDIFEKLNFFSKFSKKEEEKEAPQKITDMKFAFKGLSKFSLNFEYGTLPIEIILHRNGFFWKVSEVILPQSFFAAKV